MRIRNKSKNEIELRVCNENNNNNSQDYNHNHSYNYSYSHSYSYSYNHDKRCGTSGITLIALVVTIVVMLVLAGVSISLLTGDNGVITKSKETKITTMLSSYVEQYKLFITAKEMENSEFYAGSLTAGKDSIYYNTKTSNSEKSIRDIINGISDEYLEKLEIIKGKMIINTQDRQLIKIAQNVGIEPNPYVIKNGELMSNDGNLLLVDENGALTLPESVTKIGTGAFSNVNGLKTIIIPGTVKTIGDYAFANNQTLEKVVIEDGVGSIGVRAFANCRNLTDVTLPDSIKTIQSQAFMTCSNIKNIEIPADIEKIDEYVFSQSGLTDLTFRGDKIKSIGKEAFFGTKISELKITKNVENIDKTAFDHCTELANIQIEKENSNFIYNNGLLMPSTKESVLFVSTKYYKKISIFEIPEGVVDFSCNIAELSNITTLKIPKSTANLNARNLPTSINVVEIAEENESLKVAEGCIYTKTSPVTLIFCYSKLSEISLQEPSEVIGKYAFMGAINATKITLNKETNKIQNQVFSNCYQLREVNIGEKVNAINPIFSLGNYNINLKIDENNENYTIENGVLYNKSKDTIITVMKQINGKFNLEDSVKIVGEKSFYAQTKMTEINLNKVVKIQDNPFWNCSGIKIIEVPSTITEIDKNAFQGASEASKIIIHRKENAISGSPFGSPFGLRAIEWDGTI